MSTHPATLLIFCDWDFTLFDTAQFGADLLQEIAVQAGVPFEQVKKEAKQFEAHPILGDYNFDDHFARHRLDPAIMWQRLEQLVRHKDYLYADSPWFIQQLLGRGLNPRILSFGVTRFQQTKILPYLKKLTGTSAVDLEYEIIMRRKSEHIAQAYPGDRGVLLDDVSDQELPKGFVEIHIDRTRTLPKPLKKPGGFVVANLDQALQVIQSL